MPSPATLPASDQLPPSAAASDRRYEVRLTPLEEYMLADDRRRYPRTFVVTLEFSGIISHDAITAALRQTLADEPRLTALVRRSGFSGHVWQPVPLRSDIVEWVADARSVELATARRIDLRRDPGLRIVVDDRPSGARVHHVFHHACCDGTGALAFLGRLYAAYSRIICPEQPVQVAAIDPTSICAVHVAEDLPQRIGSESAAAKAARRRTIDVLGTRAVELRARCSDSSQRESDPILFPGSIANVLTSAQTRQLKRAARMRCATLNDLLLSAMFCTLRDWNARSDPAAQRAWYRIMAPVDLRSPAHDRLPAANLVSCVFVTQRGVACNDRERLLSAVSQRMQYAVGSRSALIMFHAIRRLSRVPGLLALVLVAWRVQATAMVSYVGDAGRALQAMFPLRRGRCRIGDVELRQVTATGPVRPGMSVNLTAGVYAGELVLNLALDPYRFMRAEAEQFLAHFVEHLLAFADDARLPAATSDPAVDVLQAMQPNARD